MQFFLELELFFEREEFAKKVFMAIRPELLQELNEKRVRSISKIRVKNSVLKIKIEANDAVALRASFNSCLKPIALASDIIETV